MPQMETYFRNGQPVAFKVNFKKKAQKNLAQNCETYQPKKSVKILLKRPDYICFALGMFFIETGKMTFNPFVVPFAVEYVGKEVTIVFHLNSCVVIFEIMAVSFSGLKFPT